MCLVAGKPVDMWAIGVVVYVLLGGYPPFHDDGTKEGHRKVLVEIKNFGSLNLLTW